MGGKKKEVKTSLERKIQYLQVQIALEIFLQDFPFMRKNIKMGIVPELQGHQDVLDIKILDRSFLFKQHKECHFYN